MGFVGVEDDSADPVFEEWVGLVFKMGTHGSYGLALFGVAAGQEG